MAGKHRGQKALGGDANSAWAVPAVRANHVWCYGFVSARTADGAPLRILNIADEFTREAVASHVARSIGARDITSILEAVFAASRRPSDRVDRGFRCAGRVRIRSGI